MQVFPATTGKQFFVHHHKSSKCQPLPYCMGIGTGVQRGASSSVGLFGARASEANSVTAMMGYKHIDKRDENYLGVKGRSEMMNEEHNEACNELMLCSQVVKSKGSQKHASE